ncbi:hypothetical protein BCR36DRAFT_582976 [Piromyces finnis]|uniref:Peptidase S59 domain-containing protein n=1 Tax=Piromyces finnis TaxID=1754191 RepID=A0A1Y1VAZ3_9FUNG|nr:hypothetical protein BCR36DRAFT_582976 [Piromyces finnis]|eukprot:ORX51427.1 hypothetical protein BCR36DRAFT_582976 [Piromyces finnis]
MFGSSFNQNQSTFGNTNSGFGTSSFGNTGFGNNQQNNSMGGFGQSTFGNNNNSAFGSNNAFGSKPAFGQSNSMFGSNNNNNQSTFGFSSNNNNTSTFGSNNNAFGKSFLGNNNSAFGSTNTFGSQSNNGFGGFNSGMNNMQNQGTGNPSYQVTTEKEQNIATPSNFHSITAMAQYKNFSFEELRLKDYQLNKKFPQNGFGSSTNTFGNNSFMNSNNNSAFGQKPAFGSSNTFGQNQMNSNSFGQNNNAFGSNNTFGSNNNTSGGLFGSNQNNTFGQMNNNNTFGSSLKPANTGFGGFGSSTFGNNNNNNTTSAFGSNNTSTGFNFGNNQNNTSAFGSTNNSFGMKPATNTSTSGFGFGNTQNNTSLSMNKPAGSTGMFGSSFSFGNNNNNNNNTSNSLFGNTQNNTTSTGLFGSNNNTATTGSLFGNKPAIGGGLNLNKPATSTLNAGNKPMFSFNSTGTTNTSFGTQNNSLFGSKPATTSFSSFNTAKPATGCLFGNTTTSTFSGMNTGLNQAPLQASIDQAPYGINPLFETVASSNVLGSSKTEVSETSKIKKSISSSQYKTTPKATTKIKLQGFSAPSPGSKPELIKKTLFDSRNIDDPQLANKLVTRKSIKKLIINKEEEKSEIIKPISSSLFIQKESKKINFNENLEISTPNKQKLNVTPFTLNKSTGSVNKSSIFLTPGRTVTETNETTINTKNEIKVETQETKTSYVNDYIISPSLSEMNRMTNEELKHVKDLIVTYPGVGSVHFLEPVDLISASPTNDRNGIVKIFGSIIIIEPKVCTVYPGEENKPPVGQGLNVPAHIELLKCWTMDKATQKPILDVEHPRFKRHMKKLKTMPETEFISFDIETGCWSFNVEHFSKYGLLNEEEEEEYTDNEKHIAKYCKIRQNSNDDSRYGVYEVVSVDISSDEEEELKNDEKMNKHEKKELLKRLVSGELELLAEEVYHSSGESSSSDNGDSSEGSDSQEKKSKENLNLDNNESDEIKKEKELGKVKSNNLKGKKDTTSNKRKHNIKHETITKLVNENPVKKLKSKGFDMNINQPITQKENVSNIKNIIEHSESVSFNHEKNYKNIGLALSRSFRVGWGPGGVLITKLPNIVKNASGGNVLPMEKIVIHHLNLFDDADDMKLREKHRITLQNQLNNSNIVNDKNEEDKFEKNILKKEDNDIQLIPKIKLSPKISFKTFTDMLSEKSMDVFDQNEIMIWKLCEALFDPILINTTENNEIVEKELDETKNKYFSKMFKKERINKWLEEYVQDEIEQNIIELRKKIKNTKDKVQMKELNNEIIFNLLSGRKLSKACKEVIKQGDYRLATVISQCGSCFESSEFLSYGKGVPGSGVMDNYTQNLINQQISLWENDAKNNEYKSNYINLWKLIGGQVDDVCYGLNSWKRTFALFVWFVNGGMDDLADSLEKYEQILESQREQDIVKKEDLISEPLPSYFENQLYKDDEKKENNIFESFDMKQKPKHFDIVYHLFKYYVNDSYNKNKIFSPQNISSDMLDYRIPWLINSLLSKSQLQNEKEKRLQDKLTISLAFQLESIGMWDWACFVCLFINNKNCREMAIKNLIYRYYPIDDYSGSIYKELCSIEKSNEEKLKASNETFEFTKNKNSELWTFLVDKLKIPEMWIHETRIIKARYANDAILEAIYLIDAKCWNKVHSLVINKILPEAIINNNTKFVEKILNKINHQEVKDWENGGQLFLSYLSIINHTTSKKNDIISYKELLEKLNTILKSIQIQLSSKSKISLSDYEILLKRKICLNSMCKEIIKCISDHESNKENYDLILSLNIPENQKLYNIKKISNEWFDNTITV